MTPRHLTGLALALCAGGLATAWLLTDTLGPWVIVPLLTGLMAAGLLIAGEARASGVASLAGLIQSAQAGLLLSQGQGPVTLLAAYLICALGLALCGLALRRAPRPLVAPDLAPDLEDRPL